MWRAVQFTLRPPSADNARATTHRIFVIQTVPFGCPGRAGLTKGEFVSMFKNHVDLIGFLGSDPETRQLENGAQLTSLSLATKTSWKNDAGSYDSRTEWHRIAVWGKLAQFAASLTKGAHIEVEGQLRHRTYQKQIQAGKKAIAVDVTAAE